MTPNQALADARQAVKDYDNADDSQGDREEAAARLAFAFTALDEWLSAGGFKPRLFTGSDEDVARSMAAHQELTAGGRGDWQVTARVHCVRDGWQSSRQIPAFTIPRTLAPALADARAKAEQIINPYGDYDVSFDIYAADENGETYRAWKQSAAPRETGGR